MGDSHHPLGQRAGRFLFYRNRGGEYSQLAKGWVTPIGVVTAAAKYLGLDGWSATAVGLAVPVVIESCAFAAGWLDIRWGGARRQMALSNLQDPYRVEMLDRAAAIERELTALRLWATRPGACVLIHGRPHDAKMAADHE